MKHSHKGIHLVLTMLVVVILITGVLPASRSAQAAVTPQIIVAPVWHPATQLTTIDEGTLGIWDDEDDDIRYVELDVMVTTTVEFWAFELNCTVDPTILAAYTQDEDTGHNHDDPTPLWWGDAWFQNGESVLVPDGGPGAHTPMTAAGKVNIAASRQGSWSSSIGQNGAENIYRLATLRFRVKNITGAMPLTCTAAFLDRNGNAVLTPTVLAPASLQISQGYAIRGKATYQLRTDHSGIKVNCSTDPDNGGPLPPVSAPLATTAANGNFTIANVRQLGHYNCVFYSNLTDPAAGMQPDIYLPSSTSFPLWEKGYRILPIELRLGNLKFDDLGGPGEPQRIQDQDLGLITSNWRKNNTTRLTGDANGDTKTDKIDLAIVAANYNLNENVDGTHYLYGLARVSDPFFDNRVWLGNSYSNGVTQYIPNAGTAQYYWPTLADDGSSLAYIRSSGQANPDARTYELYKVNPAVPTTQTLVISRAAIGNRNAFAPSWSPDGTQIAFICTTGDNYKYDKGQLCVVDADGRNFRVIDPYNAAVTHIYPPAWLNPNTVAVAVGPSLVLFNLSSGEKVWWDEDLPGAGTGSEPGKADMPRITHSFLLYRYTPDDIGDGPIIRMAELEYLPNTWIPDIKPWTDWQAPPAARPTFVHTDIRARFEQPTLSYGTPHIDYYTASLTNGIVISWYNHELPESLFVNFNFDFDAYNNGNINGTSTCAAPGCYPMYTEAGYPLIDGARGNPAWATRSANPWDYDPNAPTFRHALRKTVERTP